MTTAITEKFNSLIDTHRRLRQQYQIEAQSLLKELAKEFFQNYPEIKLISWTQYLRILTTVIPAFSELMMFILAMPRATKSITSLVGAYRFLACSQLY